MNPYVILGIAALVVIILFYGLVGMYGGAKSKEGKAVEDAKVLTNSAAKRKEAEDAEAEELKRLKEKYK